VTRTNKTALPAVLPAVFALTGLLVANSASAAPRFVDNIGTCRGLKPCYQTVIDAIAASRAGDFIRIFPGVYRESIVIDSTRRNMILMAFFPAQMPFIAAPEGSSNAITIEAPGVQIRNLIIEAPGAAVTNDVADGGVGTLIMATTIAGRLTFNDCSLLRIFNNSILGSIQISGSMNNCQIATNTINGGVANDDGSFTTIDLNAGGTIMQNVQIHNNVVRGGGIHLAGAQPALRNHIESNFVEGGGIVLSGDMSVDGNFIRNNIVRDGTVRLEIASVPLGRNWIDTNFTAGSPSNGIDVVDPMGGTSIIHNNTAIDSANCDISDSADTAVRQNTWLGNVFRTNCGTALR
jgi:hypothetical protein